MDELLLETFTVVFVDAVAVKVTVPCELLPPETLVGLNVSEDKVTLPPPLTQTLFVHVWPLPHVPQVSVPPQPSAMLPQLKPSPEHVFGVHGPVLSTKFALADTWLQVADAATVTNC